MSKKKKASKKIKAKVFKAQASPKPKSLRWYGLVVAIFGFLLYANTLSNDYCLDDFSVIKDNFVVKKGDYKTIFSTHYRYGYWSSKGTLYRPLTLAMFATEWKLAPDTPALGHFVNILFFAWSGWLLYQLLSLLFGDKYQWLPLVVSLIFVAHPVHTEVVANIKSRDEIMTFFLGLAALYYLIKFVDTDKIKLLVFSVFLFGLSVFSKESAITWLGIFPLTILFFRKEHRKKTVYTAAYLLPAFFFWVVRSRIIGQSVDVKDVQIIDNFFAKASSAEYYGSALYMVLRYLQTLFLPTHLVSDLGFNQIPLKNFANWGVWLIVALIIGAVYATFRFWPTKTQKPHVGVYGVLFFTITFSIYSNLVVKIGSSYGERFLFIPSLGFALFAGYGLYWLAQKINKPLVPKVSNPIFLGLLIVLLGYSIRTIKRNKDWYDSATLYASDIPKSPNSAKLNYHHGLEVGKKGNALKGQQQTTQYKKAIVYFDKAISIYPAYSDAYALKGLYYFKLNEYDKAMNAYNLAIKYNANSPNAYNNMGIIFFQRGDVKNAERVYKLALKYNPRFVDAYRNLGAVYGSTKRFEQAIEQFKKGLQYDPNNKTLLKYIGAAYRDLGKPELGRPYLEQAGNLH
ncbi:MAG TPA: tetratricopeptide repeat protein [Saprospiraceae bacterium]|nr:tetratricopeptide repeat protein [Saprospiraceae bacterium]